MPYPGFYIFRSDRYKAEFSVEIEGVYLCAEPHHSNRRGRCDLGQDEPHHRGANAVAAMRWQHADALYLRDIVQNPDARGADGRAVARGEDMRARAVQPIDFQILANALFFDEDGAAEGLADSDIVVGIDDANFQRSSHEFKPASGPAGRGSGTSRR